MEIARPIVDSNRRLRLSVRNPTDTDALPSSGDGIGLANVAGRLKLLYEQRAKLEIDRQPGLFEVTLDLALRKGSEEATG